MKRAGCQWGIGRYLYELPEAFVKCSEKKIQGYNYQFVKKENKALFWLTPDLPLWALPEHEQKAKKENWPVDSRKE